MGLKAIFVRDGLQMHKVRERLQMHKAARSLKPLEWYALNTCPRHEKVVHQQLHARSLEFYLPL